MSLTELIPTVLTLPKPDQVRLLHFLIDEVGGVTLPEEGLTPELRALIPPPGSVVEVWFPQNNAEGLAAMAKALEEYKKEQ